MILYFRPSKTGKNFNIFFIIAAVIIVTAFVVTLFFWKPAFELPNRGKWDGRTYSNTEAKISLTVPDGWQIMSDTEIIENFEYTSDIYSELKSHSEYVDAFISKPDDSMLYIKYYSPGTEPCTALKEAQRNVQLTGTSVKYQNVRFEVNPEDITSVVIGGLTYERFAYTLTGVYGARFIEYYRCLEGETGGTFVQLNVTLLKQTPEEEFLALFNS